MELKKLECDLTVCKVSAIADIDMDADFYFIGKTDEEISLVCKTEDTPEKTVERDDGWKGFRIQEVLKRDTVISRALGHYGIFFDIENRILHCNGEKYDIDYEKYRSRHFLSGLDEKLDRIAHRVYYDYCVNGFLLNDDVLDYGTSIHERPVLSATQNPKN